MAFSTEAILMARPGAAEVLAPGPLALPWPGADDHVLVRLVAAGVNPADTFFRALGPYVGDGAGCVLGHDGAGIVEQVGAGVSTLQPGDPVCFCHGGIGAEPGTYARHAVVPEALLARKPEAVDFVQAAALPLVFITMWEALSERAAVRPGERVLIHAGAGGTGHIGVQLARLLGARVAATVGSPEKAGFVTRLGAERAILYRDEDFVRAAQEWTGDRGLDVALDNVGGEAAQSTFRAMATYGRVVTLMGIPRDTESEDAYNGNLTLHNVMMLTPMWRRMHDRLREQAAMLRTGLDWLARGRLEVQVQHTVPLERAAEAHRLLEAGGMTGKVVLTID